MTKSKTPPEPNRVVYFFGDSFVAGFGDPSGLGWVGRAQQLAPAALRFAAVNRGVPGATCMDVARTWHDAAERLMAEGATDDAGAMFSFGTNDVIAGLPPVQTSDTLGECLALAGSIGMPAFVVGPPPIGDMPEAERRLGALSGDLALVCAMHGVAYVEVHDELVGDRDWQSEIAAGDGSHPREAGYARLAELVVEGGFFAWLETLSH